MAGRRSDRDHGETVVVVTTVPLSEEARAELSEMLGPVGAYRGVCRSSGIITDP
jgi:hypothetical protein